MWQQTYTPIANSLSLSASVAALPILVLLLLLGVGRKPAWISSLCGLAAAALVAVGAYGMPAGMISSAIAYGVAFGVFPVGWIVFGAILLYRIALETGKFEVIKDSIGSLTADHRLQALLVAFAFGGFLEGCAGFGAPVAVAAAMLTGLGFPAFYAAGICLLANTAPVAFGSIGIPIVTLQGTTGLPLTELSASVGRICAPIALVIPAYMCLIIAGWRGLAAVAPAAAVCGITFAGAQFLISNYVGPYLASIGASLAAVLGLVVLLRFWHPRQCFKVDDHVAMRTAPRHSRAEVVAAWVPYGLLVLFVLLWGFGGVKALLDQTTFRVYWPGLHNLIIRTPPITAANSPYPAIYTVNLLSAAGTACVFAALASAAVLRIRPGKLAAITAATAKQLALSMVTIAAVMGLAFLMNYSGATATLGLAFATTAALFPFFSSLLGWLGVFLTGSDTSANALFGNLQVVTATKLHLDPVLMAASNSSGGVMGKMISLQSIAVATAATGAQTSEESRLFRFTLGHSILLATAIGLIVLAYSYAMPK